MKQKEEVTVIVESLCKNGLLTLQKTDRARYVVKEALKEIRCRKYAERHKVAPKWNNFNSLPKGD